MTTVKMMVLATLPEDKLAAFTQHIRDFDVANPGCEFRMAANAPNIPLAQMVNIVRGIAPNFQHVRAIDDDDSV